MYYSSIGLLAALILVIENHDIVFQRAVSQKNQTLKIYRRFLFAVLAYYVTDILWGLLDANHLVTLLFIDTEVYFVSMALGLFFWAQFVISYLNGTNGYAKALSLVGYVFAGAMLLITALNIFTPILFRLDADGTYHPSDARHVLLIIQVALFILTSAYVFSVAARTKSTAGRRYRAIGLFGLTMAVLLTAQLFYPLLPLYSAGYLLGTSLLHIFVFGDEKEAYQWELEESLQREKRQRADLISAQRLAHTDGLTSVKNKLAYSELETRKNAEIENGALKEFAIAVFDLNDLKTINDRLGHEAGDKYIVDACRLICNQFKHSPVFRIGGDEFAVFLEGSDYWVRDMLMKQFNARIEENVQTGDVIVAGGIAAYNPGEDSACSQVFERADRQMYQRKAELKHTTL